MTKKLPFWKMIWRSRKSFFGFLLVMIVSTIIFFVIDRMKIIIQDLSITNRLKNLKENEELGKGIGCDMPQLDPFAAKYSDNLPTLTCEGTDWVHCHKSECSVVKEILKTVKDIVCFYRDIMYSDDTSSYIGYPTKVPGNEKFSLNMSDHVKIDCTGREVKRPDVHAHWSGNKAGFRPIKVQPVPPNRVDSYNVMILCLGSTSRIKFIRKMPNSYKYLTKKLKAVILKSYNVVGEGSTPALYPILSGKPEEDHIYNKKKPVRNKYIDPKKFIFYKLKDYGYRTAYFEDMPWIGPPIYKFNWFKSPPAHHYLRALVLADNHAEKNQDRPVKHCIGAKPQYQLLMNLANEFLQINGKKFCFTTIEDMEYENFTVLPTPDKILLSFLQTLSARKTLEDTLLLIMGDHGFKFSTNSITSQGKLEDRLPLMAILLPEKLKKRRPAALKALKANVDTLTTPFDIHATILDVLDLLNKTKPYKLPGSQIPRALSVLEPIPKSRSCGQAAVMPHWCACTHWSNVSQSDTMYQKTASVLAEFIDSISREQRRKCALRHLSRIEWVIRQKATDLHSKAAYFSNKEFNRLYNHPTDDSLIALDSYYQAKIILSPGKSAFEGTLLYNTANDYFMMSQRDISRVNAFDDESKCISTTHPHLRHYCYCNDKLENTTTFTLNYKR